MTLFVTVAKVSSDGDDRDGPKIPKNEMHAEEKYYAR